MPLFSRKPQVVMTGGISMSMTRDGVSMEGVSEEFALTLAAYWTETFGKKETPKKNPIGFTRSIEIEELDGSDPEEDE